jgi:hypothetical protein
MAAGSQHSFSLSFDPGLPLFDAPQDTHNRRSERRSAGALQLLGSMKRPQSGRSVPSTRLRSNTLELTLGPVSRDGIRTVDVARESYFVESISSAGRKNSPLSSLLSITARSFYNHPNGWGAMFSLSQQVSGRLVPLTFLKNRSRGRRAIRTLSTVFPNSRSGMRS